jgi:hypothetical protein
MDAYLHSLSYINNTLLSNISTWTFFHQVPQSKVLDVKKAGIDIENIVISSVLKNVIGSIPR